MFGCLKLVRRAIVATTVLTMLVIACAAGTVVVTARKHDSMPSDALVVLGAAQYAGRPTPLLANRLDHARLLFREGVARHIITVGSKRPGDATTEAQAGARYLQRAGVPRSALVAVRAGTDTWTSMEAVVTACRERGWTTVTIVSDPAHLARTAAMARRLGLVPRVSGTVGGSGSKVTAAYVTRESVGLMWFWAQRWLPTALTSHVRR